MSERIPTGTFRPPPGRPSWAGSDDLPLIYLGWGHRDFARHPLVTHYDRGTSYFSILSGAFVVRANGQQQTLRAPSALIVDVDCAFGITQPRSAPVDILAWVWRGRPSVPELRPQPGGMVAFELRPQSLKILADLHTACRDEVALADSSVQRNLSAMRDLLESALWRASHPSPAAGAVRWNLAQSWMATNLSIHAPVPALCDYLRMSPSTLHRFFIHQSGLSPGAYFRQMKVSEARRLIDVEGWQVKATAYHLGYRHPNDLSRALVRSGAATV